METNNNLTTALALIEKSVLVEINNETKVATINDDVFENVKQALLNLPKVEILRDAENKIVNDFDALDNSKKVIKDLRSKIEPIKTNLKEFEKSIKALSNVDDVQARVDELLKIIKTYEENLSNVVTSTNEANRKYHSDRLKEDLINRCAFLGLSDFQDEITKLVIDEFQKTIARKTNPSVLDTERDIALQNANEHLTNLSEFIVEWKEYKESELWVSKPSNVHKFAKDTITTEFNFSDHKFQFDKFKQELGLQKKNLHDLKAKQQTQTQTQKSEPVQQTQPTVAVANNTQTSQANETTVTQPAPVTPAPTDNRKVLKPVVFELTITSAKNADFKTDASGIIAFNTKTNTVHVKPREFMKFMQEQGIVNFFALEQVYGD